MRVRDYTTKLDGVYDASNMRAPMRELKYEIKKKEKASKEINVIVHKLVDYDH